MQIKTHPFYKERADFAHKVAHKIKNEKHGRQYISVQLKQQPLRKITKFRHFGNNKVMEN